jgi:NAD(P)-dependent dehydrogenase (short-subunit alcohol dehydrogenase family)
MTADPGPTSGPTPDPTPDGGRVGDLAGLTAVVTGAGSGIGAVVARGLAARGAVVVALGRSPGPLGRVADDLGTEPVVADYTDLAQVRAAAATLLERLPRIDLLVHNAGGLVAHRETTGDGFERTFQVNHLAPFLLNTLLADRLRANASEAPVRVVTTASAANQMGHVRLDDLQWDKRRWMSFRVYGTTKLENILFMRELARRSEGSGLSAYSVHPGVVASGFGGGHKIAGLLYRGPLRSRMLTEAEGAAPILRVATDPRLPARDGAYFQRFDAEKGVNRQAGDADLARRLWEQSAALVGVSG